MPGNRSGVTSDPPARLEVRLLGENPLDWAFSCCRLPDGGAEEIYSRGADILIAAQFGRR
jgi:hypothetical protein